MMKPPLTMLGKTSTATALSPSAFAPGVFLYSVLSDWVASRSICPALAASARPGASRLSASAAAARAALKLLFVGLIFFFFFPLFLLVECILIVCSRFYLLGQGNVRRDLVAQHNAVFVFDLEIAGRFFGRHRLQHLRREGAPAIALVALERDPVVEQLLRFLVGERFIIVVRGVGLQQRAQPLVALL